MGFGALLMLAASPAAAERIGLQSFQLARRQIALLPFAAALLIAVSLAPPRWIRRLACLGLIASIVLLVLTLVAGPEIKGPTRWISLGSLSLQPSGFATHCFAVFTAGRSSLHHAGTGLTGMRTGNSQWPVVGYLQF